MAKERSSPTKTIEDVLEDIRNQLQDIQFGSLEISIHNGKIVQVERREKKRYGKGDNAS